MRPEKLTNAVNFWTDDTAVSSQLSAECSTLNLKLKTLKPEPSSQSPHPVSQTQMISPQQGQCSRLFTSRRHLQQYSSSGSTSIPQSAQWLITSVSASMMCTSWRKCTRGPIQNQETARLRVLNGFLFFSSFARIENRFLTSVQDRRTFPHKKSWHRQRKR